MVGSIQTGCKVALAHWPGMPGFLVAPADMPALPVEAFRTLASAGLARSHDGTEPAALFAAHKEKLGHPVWIPVQFIKEILALDQGGRLRDYLLTRTWAEVQFDSDAIFLDLDTREDYLANVAKD